MERPIPPSVAKTIAPIEKPKWIRSQVPWGETYKSLKEKFRERKLHTVCEEARCPNVSECWNTGTATLMLGGDICTRACRFCAIKTARRPPALDPHEPDFVALSIKEMGLRYVVLTSVDRDDLEDGGSLHFQKTIRRIKEEVPELLVEALVPDFRGESKLVSNVVESRLDVYAHNIETIRRLHYRVRDPRAKYEQSLETLKFAKIAAKTINHRLFTKSSIMLGFGETRDEVIETMKDLRKFDVDAVTLGQYLRPTKEHLPVEKYWSIEEFKEFEDIAFELGFSVAASGPMVRSSYKAAELHLEGKIKSARFEV